MTAFYNGLGAEDLLDNVVEYLKEAGLLGCGEDAKGQADYDECDSDSAVLCSLEGAAETEPLYGCDDDSKASVLFDSKQLLADLRRVQSGFDAEGIGRSLEATHLAEAISLTKSGSLQKAALKIITLLRAIRPFDIAEFLGLYKRTSEMADVIEGESCWLLAGPTGAGKSTTIHYLAGSEMKRMDGGHIFAHKIHSEALASLPKDAVKPGHNLSTSETRYIAGVAQDLSKIAGLDVDPRDAHIVFVDSPGFEDAAGPEIDLANGLGMVRSLQKAKRVKVVVVFSKYSFAARMKTLKNLAATLSGILVKYEDVLQNSAVCLLTKAEAGVYEERHLRADFANVCSVESAKEPRDEAFIFMCWQLSKKMKPMPAKCVWPLRPELRAKVLHTVANETDWIKTPARAFQEFVSGETMAKLRAQMAAYKRSIAALSKHLNESKCRVISARLFLMHQMVEVLPNFDKLREFLADSEQIAVDNWNARIEGAKEALEGVDKVTPEGFAEKLEAFDSDCHALVGAEIWGLMDRVKGVSTVNVFVNATMKKLLASLTNDGVDDRLPAVDSDAKYPEESEATEALLHSGAWTVTMAKVRLLRERYEHKNQALQRIFEETVQRWNKSRDEATAKCKTFIGKHAWAQTRGELLRVVHLSNLIAAAMGEDFDSVTGSASIDSSPTRSRSHSRSQLLALRTSAADSQMTELALLLQRTLHKQVAAACSSFGFTVSELSEVLFALPQSDVDSSECSLSTAAMRSFCAMSKVFDSESVTKKLKECAQLLEKCISGLKQRSFGEHIPAIVAVTAQTVERLFFDEVARYCNEALLSPANALLDGEAVDGKWTDAEKLLSRCGVLRCLQRVDAVTAKKFYNTKRRFDARMDALSREAQDIVSACVTADDSTPLDYGRVVHCVRNLQKAGCSLESDQLRHIGDRIGAYVELLKERADAIYVSLERSEELSRVGELMSELRKLCKLDDAMPDVKRKADEVFASLKNQVISNLHRIARDFDLEAFSTERMRLELIGLKHLRKAWCESLGNDAQRKLVADCSALDLEATVCAELRKRCLQIDEKMSALDKERDARHETVAGETEAVKTLQTKVLRLIDMEMDDESIGVALAKGGFSSIKELGEKRKQLAEDLKRMCVDLDDAAAVLNSEKLALESNATALKQYAVKETAVLAESGISEADILRYRNCRSLADARTKAISRVLASGDDFTLPMLNIHSAVSALSFVTRCKTIAWKGRGDAESIPVALDIAGKRLKDYLFAYAQLWDKAFGDALDTCATVSTFEEAKSSAEGSADASSLESAAEVLSTRLRELRNMCEHCALCTALFRKPPVSKVSDVFAMVCTKHTALRTSILRSKQSEPKKCAKASEYCQVLSRIDGVFCKWAAAMCSMEAVSFADLAEEAFGNMSADICELARGCITAFDDGNFQMLQLNLNDLLGVTESGVDKVTYTRICAQLCSRLSQLLGSATMSVLQLDDMVSETEMFKLNQELVNLRSALTALEDHTPKSLSEGILEKEKSLKEHLSGRLTTVLEGAENAAKNGNFAVAEKRMAVVKNLKSFFSGGSQMIHKEFFKELDDKKVAVTKTIEDERDKIVDKFKDIDLVNCKGGNPYAKLQTKRLYQELQQVWDHKPEYRKMWEKIETDIFCKMTATLSAVVSGKVESADSAETVVPLLEYRKRKRLLRMCEGVLRWLPADVSAQLSPEVDDTKQEFAETQKGAAAEVTVSLKSGDWGALARSFDALADGNPIVLKKAIQAVESRGVELLKAMESALAVETLDAEAASKVTKLLADANELRKSFLGDEMAQFPKANLKASLQQCEDKCTASVCETCNALSRSVHFGSTEDMRKASKQLSFVTRMFAEFTKMGDEKRASDAKEKLRKALMDFLKDVATNTVKALKSLDLCILEPLLDKLKGFDEESDVLKLALRFPEVSESAPHYADACDLVKTALNGISERLAVRGVFNEDTRQNSSTRLVFFEALKVDLGLLQRSETVCRKHLRVDARSKLLQPCISAIKADVLKLNAEVVEALNERIITNDALLRVDTCLKILESVREHVSKRLVDCESEYAAAKRAVEKRVGSAFAKLMGADIDVDTAATQLIELQRMKDMLDDAGEAAEEAIGESLKRFSTDKKLSKSVMALSKKLCAMDANCGGRLIEEQSAFKNVQRAMWKKRIKELTIDEVLRELRGYNAHFDKKALRRLYTTVNKVYQSTIDRMLTVTSFDQINFRPLIARIVQLAKEALSAGGWPKFSQAISWFSARSKGKGMLGFGGGAKKKVHMQRAKLWTDDMLEAIPELLGLCFALWTMKNADTFFDVDGDSLEDKRNAGYLLQPRVAQVVSILCLLGLDERTGARPPNTLVNNLVEIGTGEGKSLTLAMASMVLALLGFDVSCSCFSEHLSKRDYEAYLNLFEDLNLTEHIHYGTFNDLFERVINRGCDIREVVRNAITTNTISTAASSAAGHSAASGRPTILLIDEVDVFFQKSFFGSLYSPSCIIPSTAFSGFIKWVWALHKAGTTVFTLESVKRAENFNAVLRGFDPKWHELLLEAAKDVIDASKTYASDSYEVVDGQIGYKYQDTVSFKAFKGYKTMFAYLKELDAGNVTTEMVDRKLGLFIKIASFSYAEIPATFYAILGVTGTLRTLTKPERDIMEQNYAIVKHVYMPSLFGVSQLKFAKNTDTVCVESGNWAFTLNEAVKSARTASAGLMRPVLVIFEDKKDLADFYMSRHFEDIRDAGASVLTEELSETEKKKLIKLATQQLAVTLTTSSFGRGIDYPVYDEQINAAGGMHVEAAYFPEANSEEVQFRGRTARQGNAGTFHMVVDIQKSLEKFGVLAADVKRESDNRTLHTFISKKRDARFVEEYRESLKFVETLRPVHLEGERMAAALRGGDMDAVRKILLAKNKGAALVGMARLCFAIDATGSMGTLLNQCKKVISQVLPRLADFLTAKSMDPKMFQIQITYYRNYNAPMDELVVASPWTAAADELVAFMQPVNPSYGFGQPDEAVEAAFAHIGDMKPKPQFVLLIADAPAQCVSEVTSKRAYRGEEYWGKTEYSTATHWEPELAKLVAAGITVNCFYLTEYARSNFEEIARRGGGGVAMKLDVRREESSVQLLMGAVVDQVLHAVGEGSRDLMDDFHKANPDIPTFL